MNGSSLFINRKQELNFLIKDIKDERKVSRFLLVSAKSGIGKTALIDKVFGKVEQITVRVVVGIQEAEREQEGFFITRIVKAVHRICDLRLDKENIFDFLERDEFYKNISSLLKKNIAKHLDIQRVAFDRDLNKEVEDNFVLSDREIMEISYRYLHSVLKNDRLVITVENFQLIDDASLDLIKDLLQSSVGLYLIGEFTVVEVFSESNNIIEKLGTIGFDFDILRIKKLDSEELIQSIVNNRDLLISILEATYEESDGNLHKFKMLRDLTYQRGEVLGISNYDSIPQKILKNLAPEAVLVLTQIAMHSGVVSKSGFLFFSKFTSGSRGLEAYQTEMVLKDLEELSLVKIEADEISIAHDSVINELKSLDEYYKAYHIVCRDWVRFYEFQERGGVKNVSDYVSILLWQIHFLLFLNDFEEISQVLEKLNVQIAHTPHNAVLGYLDQIAGSYEDTKITDLRSREVVKWLVIVYYKCGYPKRVISIVEKFIKAKIKEYPVIVLCYYASLSTLSKYRRQIFNFILFEYQYLPKGVQLGLSLVELRNLRSLHELGKVTNLWKDYYRSKKYENTSFEAGFLKYVSLAIHEDFNLRTKCLKRALQLSARDGNQYMQTSILNILARDHVYLGDFVEASNFFEKALKSAGKSLYPTYQLWNNLAVFEMIRGDISLATRNKLENSLRICEVDGNQIIISSNLLALSIISGDISSGFRIYNELVLSLTTNFDPKSTFGLVSMFNCFRFAQAMGDNEHAQNLHKEYLSKYTINRFQNLWNFLIFEKGDNPMPWMTNGMAFPHFIYDWEIDYYTALENFQELA